MPRTKQRPTDETALSGVVSGSGTERQSAPPIEPSKPRRHVAKGTYASLADPEYVAKRDAVRAYVPEVLGLLLKVKRIEHAELAAQMGLSVSALRDRLRGKTEIPIGELVAVADLLEVPMSVFLDQSATISDILGIKTWLTGSAVVNQLTGGGLTALVLHDPLPGDNVCHATNYDVVGSASSARIGS